MPRVLGYAQHRQEIGTTVDDVSSKVVTHAAAARQVVTDPVVTDPVVTDPVVTDPAVADAATAAAQPVVADAATAVTHPVVADAADAAVAQAVAADAAAGATPTATVCTACGLALRDQDDCVDVGGRRLHVDCVAAPVTAPRRRIGGWSAMGSRGQMAMGETQRDAR